MMPTDHNSQESKVLPQQTTDFSGRRKPNFAQKILPDPLQRSSGLNISQEQLAAGQLDGPPKPQNALLLMQQNVVSSPIMTCPAKSPMLKVTQKSWENIESRWTGAEPSPRDSYLGFSALSAPWLGSATIAICIGGISSSTIRCNADAASSITCGCGAAIVVIGRWRGHGDRIDFERLVA
mmetsp:Transcript_60952/g.126167  ORF Transcript_60952/g.126167 Transcript_60952/m.126167 type:complete len:180 (-) Transcript_60952:7-546(-)